jgi:macrolide transport system ATP-binding/permease protein
LWLLRLLDTVRLRFRSLFRRNQVERDLEDEVRAHLERRMEADIARGMSPVEARDAALRAMGGEQRKEECRDMRHVAAIENRIQDFRFAVRQLLRYRGFACAAVVVLALGVAASVSIFGFVDAALIRPLPYEEPSRLFTVFGTRRDAAASQKRGGTSYLDFLEWRERGARAFQSLAAYDVRAGFTLVTTARPEPVSGLRVSGGFFDTLGVRPLLGREFRPDEEGPSAPPTVMLSYTAWQTRFHGSPDVLGRTVTLQSPWLPSGEPHVVIGVLPPNFHFTMAGRAEFWATIRGVQGCWGARACRSLEVVGRLADSASVQAASANMTAVIEQLQREYPADHRSSETAKLVSLSDVMLGDVRPVLLMLLSGAGLLLVIACINVISLLLARTDSRTREIAVRNSLGASSARLALQFATEAVVLTVVATVLGLMLASLGIRFLTGLLSADMMSRMPYLQGIGVNLRLVVFACAVSASAALVFALTPFLRTSMANTLAGLKEGGRGSAGRSRRRFGSHLVVAELAIAGTLIAGAGLLSKSLYRLLHVTTGINTHQLAAVSVTPVSTGAGTTTLDSEPAGVLAREVAERVGALPGIESIGYADILPLGPGLAPSSTFWVVGRAEDQQVAEDWPVRRVSARYFNTLHATLLRGRYFSTDEVAAVRPVVIINHTAAQRYFPGDDPIGRSIAFGSPSSPARDIVGIVADIKDGPPETPAHPSAYVPFDQTGFSLVVRTQQPEPALFPSLLAAIHEIRPGTMVGGLTTMTERINRLPSASMNRSLAWLIGGFAAVALILSVVGLYGVVAYTVSQRAREIGIRIALGAVPQSVYRLVLGEAVWLGGIGGALGAIGAVTAGIFMRHLLFDVEPWDVPTLLATACLLTISVLLASYLPARRAASVNPVDVLRAE